MKRKSIKISWYAWCLYKLGRRDYSAYELKLEISKRAAESGQEVDPEPIVNQLLEEGILNDERFLVNRIRYYTESNFRKGPKKLRVELLNKYGIALELLDRYLDENDVKWGEIAQKNCHKMLLENNQPVETPQQIPQKLFVKIRHSLYNKGFNNQQIQLALDGLSPLREKKEQKLPGDMQKWVESRMETGRGPFDIRQHLLQKGMDKADIPDFLDYPEEVWIEIASREREKRFGNPKPKTFKEKKKQTDFLQRRGFSFDQIRVVLDND